MLLLITYPRDVRFPIDFTDVELGNSAQQRRKRLESGLLFMTTTCLQDVTFRAPHLMAPYGAVLNRRFSA